MNDDKFTLSSGMLDVGDGHAIYFQDWGNKNSDPIFFFHGGPGAGLKDGHKLGFNPLKHHIVFHDQRGSGKSTPHGSAKHNTTDKLIDDINQLRSHLGYDKVKISLTGGSWGSTLALAYAIAYPDNVKKMLIYGIYTGTRQETDYIQQGGLSTHFPESWQQYIEVVPEDRRDNTVAYYAEMMGNPDPEISNDYIRRWNINESSASTIDPDLLTTVLNNAEVDDRARSVALLEAHYFLHDCFLPDKHILNNAHKLATIPIIMVQGRHDHVCPPLTAYNLANALGSNCHLHITPGSHAREGAYREVIRAYVHSWLG